jgi:hypothetical protein
MDSLLRKQVLEQQPGMLTNTFILTILSNSNWKHKS